MLTVLSVGYPLAPVSADAAGGAEQILATLDAALVRAGHRSLVVAPADSRVAGTLLPVKVAQGPLSDAVRERLHPAYAAAILDALNRWPVDVVHLHGLDFSGYLPPPGPPVLATLHLPADGYPSAIWTIQRPATMLNCVSWTQHQSCPPSPLLVPPVANGVPLEHFAAPHAKRRFALALGRVCPEKGFHLALHAAHRAAVPLLIAGKLFHYREHEGYFRDALVPRLDGHRRFLGPVGLRRKRRLLGGARCLLIPSLVHETSSLVAMEAIASGTPVIALRSGALPEIVEHGRTGFVVGSAEEMADAIGELHALDPRECRAAARERFSAVVMVERYLALYDGLRRAAPRVHSYPEPGGLPDVAAPTS